MSTRTFAQKPKPSTLTFNHVPRNLVQRKCACGGSAGLDGECAECHKKRLSRTSHSLNQAGPETVPSIVHEVLRSPGQPLDSATRSFMEPRFGHDFSKVRVHRDVKSAESAAAVNALAYTVGQDIVFEAGQYSPETKDGKKLLAHELVHVEQQQQNPYHSKANLISLPEIDEVHSDSEREAISVAEQVAVDGSASAVPSSRTPDRRLQRQASDSAQTEQVCGGVDNFFRTILLIDPNIVSDGVSCICLGVGVLDLLPIPGVGTNPVVEKVDCLCNIFTTLQEIYDRGSDGSCWSVANLTTADILELTALAELTIIDCGSLPFGTFLGSLIGGTVAGPVGAAAGAVIVDSVVDVVAMAGQNLITQGTPFPVAQLESCNRLITPRPNIALQGQIPSPPITTDRQRMENWAININTNVIPGWRNALPDCPCTDQDARSDPQNWQGGIGGCPTFFHPGATTGYRSTRGFASIAGTSHGQQCCYDNGQLITSGPGAGTPDLWSPVTNSIKHQQFDVLPWFILRSGIYNQYWVPNKARLCRAGDFPAPPENERIA